MPAGTPAKDGRGLRERGLGEGRNPMGEIFQSLYSICGLLTESQQKKRKRNSSVFSLDIFIHEGIIYFLAAKLFQKVY